MKKLKLSIIAIVAFLLSSTITMNAQDQKYWILKDEVKPAMQAEYEKASKEFAEACKTYNVQDFSFNCWRHDNGSYVYSSVIKNMADLDRDIFKTLKDNMGKEKLQALYDRLDKSYYNEHSFIVTAKNDLSYMPNGALNAGDFRKYHFFYITPENSKAVAEKLKEIKDLFAKKGSKEYYVIMHSGFGADEEFYLAILGAKDVQDEDRISNENNKLLGDDWTKKWNELFVLMTRHETETSMYRADLSYNAKK